VTVIPESWYFNCSTGATAERGSLCVSVPVARLQDSCARFASTPQTDPVPDFLTQGATPEASCLLAGFDTVLITSKTPVVQFLPQISRSALPKASPPGAPLALWF